MVLPNVRSGHGVGCGGLGMGKCKAGWATHIFNHAALAPGDVHEGGLRTRPLSLKATAAQGQQV